MVRSWLVACALVNGCAIKLTPATEYCSGFETHGFVMAFMNGHDDNPLIRIWRRAFIGLYQQYVPSTGRHYYSVNVWLWTTVSTRNGISIYTEQEHSRLPCCSNKQTRSTCDWTISLPRFLCHYNTMTLTSFRPILLSAEHSSP